MENEFDTTAGGRELGWDDEIENDSSFELLPAGDYDFTVKAVERGRYPGGDKMGPCNMATVIFGLKDTDGKSVEIRKNFYLNTNCEGILCAFFTSIGMRKHGERVHMNWSAAPGCTGRCKITVRDYTKKDGTPGQSNDIKKFYEPEDKPAAPAAGKSGGYVPGQF